MMRNSNNKRTTLSPNRKPSRAELHKLFEQLHELGLDRRDNTATLITILKRNPAHHGIYELLQRKLHDEQAIQSATPDPLRATTVWQDDTFTGPIEMGSIPQNEHMYRCAPQMLTDHLAVFGRTHGGKTTAIKSILIQLKRARPRTSLTIFEKKREFTDVARALDMNVVTLNDFKMNVLKPPPQTAPHVWISLLTQIMVDILDIRVASSSFILKMYHEMIHKYSGPNPPNLKDLYRYIENKKFRAYSHDARYQETVSNRLCGILAMLPNVFVCDTGFDVSQMLKEDTLILLHDVPNLAMQNFLINLIVAQMFLYRTVIQGHQPDIQNLIVLDEAAAFFRRVDEVRDHPSYLANVISQARAYGIGLVAACQMATDLSHMFLANTGIKMLVGGFERTDDTGIFMNARPHTNAITDRIKSVRTPGHAFITDPRHPFHIECQINMPQLPAELTDQEIAERSKTCAQKFGWDRKDYPAPTPQKMTKKAPTPKPPQQNAPPNTEHLVLTSIEQNTFQTLSDRSTQLKIPQTSLKKIIEKLEADSLIIRYPVHHRAGRPRDLFDVTVHGFKLLNKEKPKQKGKGGYLHQFYQQRINDFFTKRNCQVQIEGRAGDKLADLLVTEQPDGHTFAVEIELHATTNNHFIDNLRLDLQSPRIHHVLTLVPINGDAKHIKKEIENNESLENLTDRIQIDVIRNYMEV